MIVFALSAFVLAALAWVTLSPRDAWPFSSYPMFARYRSDPCVRFYRLRFVLADGSTRSLPLSLGRLADEFHGEFAVVWSGAAAHDPRPLAVVERYRGLIALCHAELGTAPKIEVLAGLVQLGAEGGASVAEQLVLVQEPSIRPSVSN